MKPYNRPKQILFFVITILCSLSVSALPDDSKQPINIQSDSAKQSMLEEGGERTVYIGNVQMTQGSILIKGNKITVISKDRKVSSLVATGTPAHFQQQSDPEKPPVKAKALNIRYDLATDTLLLLNEASIDQEGSVISGKKINYNIATESVVASGGKNKSRVIMVLEPSTSDDEDDAQSKSNNIENSIENNIENTIEGSEGEEAMDGDQEAIKPSSSGSDINTIESQVTQQ